jgi:hypothetical protein
MSNPQLDLQMRVERWRQKAREGTLTLEETRDAIKVLRAGRSLITAATGGSKTNAKAKAKVAKPSGDDLLSELEGL